MNLNNHIVIDKATIESSNLCSLFDERDLKAIGDLVVERFLRDKKSRADWERRTSRAMDLALQVQQAKTYPWDGCSNVKFPLITIAALQFHSRAYPAIVNGRSIVDARVIGDDPSGVGAAQAMKIASHMSWQRLEQDEEWEGETDRSLINVSVVGVGFKKSYYDASLGYNVSRFVPARDLVFDYWATSIESCRVKTHVIPKFRNDICEAARRGQYRNCENEDWFLGDAPLSTNVRTNDIDSRSGKTPPDSDGDTPFTLLEQHCWMDLDGDGYEEPYIITVEESSGYVLRIVTRFDRIEDVEYNKKKQIVKITAFEYFTKIPFVPNPDGSMMDIGFGTLLGPLNESVNSAINQLFDAGTLSNTAGGFLGRGAKIKGGVYKFQPFGWQRVDATGDDLRKSIVPLPVREPSAVMFNLLSLLIEYTNRVAGSTDMMVGENPGQNTPAETSRAMLEQGQKIYSAIFKRIWKCHKQEFKKLFVLNSLFLPTSSPFGEGGTIRREDYITATVRIIPAADPTIASDGARYAQARLLKEAAQGAAGYNADEVERQYLRAIGITDVSRVYPGQESMPPAEPDVKLQIQQMKNELEMAKLQEARFQFIMTLQQTVRLNDAKVAQLTAQAEKLAKQAESEADKQRVAAFRAGIEAMREQNNNTNQQLDRMLEEVNNARSNAGTGRVSGMAASSGNSPTDAMGFPIEGALEGGMG